MKVDNNIEGVTPDRDIEGTHNTSVSIRKIGEFIKSTGNIPA